MTMAIGRDRPTSDGEFEKFRKLGKANLRDLPRAGHSSISLKPAKKNSGFILR